LYVCRGLLDEGFFRIGRLSWMAFGGAERVDIISWILFWWVGQSLPLRARSQRQQLGVDSTDVDVTLNLLFLPARIVWERTVRGFQIFLRL